MLKNKNLEDHENEEIIFVVTEPEFRSMLRIKDATTKKKFSVVLKDGRILTNIKRRGKEYAGRILPVKQLNDRLENLTEIKNQAKSRRYRKIVGERMNEVEEAIRFIGTGEKVIFRFDDVGAIRAPYPYTFIEKLALKYENLVTKMAEMDLRDLIRKKDK